MGGLKSCSFVGKQGGDHRGTTSATSLQRQSPGNLYKHLPKLQNHLAKYTNLSVSVGTTASSPICDILVLRTKIQVPPGTAHRGGAEEA